MNEKTRELKIRFINEAMPFAEQLREDGKTDREILGIIHQHVKLKIKHFYNRSFSDNMRINAINLLDKIESKAEAVVYFLLEKHEIDFKIQYKIGSYRVDFLINNDLVLEIDGPHHGQQKEYDTQRDKYLKGLGYKVLRLPIWVFSVDDRAAIEAIKELINQN